MTDFPVSCDAEASPPVLVILGDHVGDGGAASLREAKRSCENVCQALHTVSVPFSRSSDSRVESDGLGDAKVAILPYNRAVSDAEAAKLRAFVAGGGKLIVFFVGRADVLATINVAAGEVARAKYEDEYCLMLFERGILFGTPARIWQPSPSARACKPLRGARIIGTWADSAADPREVPAVIISENGAYVSQTFASGNMPEKGALMRALVGQFAPDIWRAVIPSRASDYGPVGRYPNLGALVAALEQAAVGSPPVRDALSEAKSALGQLTRAIELAAIGNFRAAAQLAFEAKLAAQQAYWRLYPSPPDELRGVWATNEGLPNWDTQMRELAKANFNAVYPYMATGGVAFYRSAVMPNAPCVAQKGDYLAEAVAAGRKYGVPVHARLLSLSTMFAPPAVKAQLAAQGRLMLDTHGNPQPWLCPSNPCNIAMECSVARELVTRYPIAGIQFDYLRYPEADTCFCPTCRAKFERNMGRRVANWPQDVLRGPLAACFADWRREQVTAIARETARAARLARPGVIVSAAVFLNWEDHRNEFGQDWKRWVDEGIVDYVCPMSYTANLEKFTRWTKRQMGWVAGKVPVCAGIGTYADGVTFSGPQQVLDEIEAARNLGARGFVIFNYQPQLARDYLPYLALGATSAPATFNLRR